MTRFTAPIRPTRHRLYTAMGISSISIAVMLVFLGSLVELAGRASVPKAEPVGGLTVLIKMRDTEPDTEPLAEVVVRPSPMPPATASAEAVDRPAPAAAPAEPELPADPAPARDWDAITRTVARASVDDYFRNRESRASLWRETRSVMFEPVDELLAQEEAPVLSGLRFKPEIHVFGLGVTVGSCFIGIPLLGVPVEQRTVAINLFVCAKDPGKPLG